MNAGKLREKTTLLTLTATAAGYAYTTGGTVYASVAVSDKKTIITGRAMGCAGAEMVFRNGSAPALMDMIIWRGDVYAVTALDPTDRLWTKATLGKVRIFDATAAIYSGGTMEFPAVLLEKYLKYAEERPMTRSEEGYLLITAKAISLDCADLISIPELGVFRVDVVHRIDPAMNEYEISRKVDR